VRRIGLAAITLLSVSCGIGSGAEGNFTSGLSRDRCDGTFPVCQTTAGCTMGVGRYLEGQFPGTRSFIVPAPEDSILNVRIFFRQEIATGIDTEIFWSEPGCFDTYQYQSEGRDIFLEAGNTLIFEKSHQVFLEGDHLVEVISDAVASYDLIVEVTSAKGKMK
jgi:hypothetical protein